MTNIVDDDSPKHSANPVVRIVAHNTSLPQYDAIPEHRVKLHATTGSVAVGDVDDLLEDAVDAGELEEVDNDIYSVAE